MGLTMNQLAAPAAVDLVRSGSQQRSGEGQVGMMISISGAFVYQPPSSPRPGVSHPATFLMKLMIIADDGVPVFDPDRDLGRLTALVVLGYPQLSNYALTLTNAGPEPIPGLGPQNFFQISGVLAPIPPEFPTPTPDWRPAAILVELDWVWGGIIPAAAPAVPDSGIATSVASLPVTQ
jgi:hypothetical protein